VTWLGLECIVLVLGLLLVSTQQLKSSKASSEASLLFVSHDNLHALFLGEFTSTSDHSHSDQSLLDKVHRRLKSGSRAIGAPRP
jgi:hypothetical protein